MKSKALIAILLLAAPVWPQNWKTAAPGYPYSFPRDYFSHPDYQTEWWYYTGNVQAADGHRFGFELTFFRSALRLPKRAQNVSVVWRPDQIYLAHLALSDLTGKEFYHQERINRAGPGIAGASLADHKIWNGNWQLAWSGASQDPERLSAATDKLRLQLNLTASKPLILNGENGVSVKGPNAGEASHYFSLPRLKVAGDVYWHNQRYRVTGAAWMDHEFFTEPADAALIGWDWFSIQLNDGRELMLYRLRRKDVAADSYSSGTYVDATGVAHHLKADDLSLQPGSEWHSPASGAHYPMTWRIRIPSLHLDLEERTDLDNQELLSRNGTTPSYWEGAVSLNGTTSGLPVAGVGYLEMTGYGQAVWLGAK